MRTRELKEWESIWIVLDISRDDRERTAACRLQTTTNRFKENYDIDTCSACIRRPTPPVVSPPVLLATPGSCACSQSCGSTPPSRSSNQRYLQSNNNQNLYFIFLDVHHHPINTLLSLLVHPKDKTSDVQKCAVVYQITCPQCQHLYLGETGRTLATRMKDHTSQQQWGTIVESMVMSSVRTMWPERKAGLNKRSVKTSRSWPDSQPSTVIRGSTCPRSTAN